MSVDVDVLDRLCWKCGDHLVGTPHNPDRMRAHRRAVQDPGSRARRPGEKRTGRKRT